MSDKENPSEVETILLEFMKAVESVEGFSSLKYNIVVETLDEDGDPQTATFIRKR